MAYNGGLNIVDLMANNPFKSINFDAQEVNGMTHFYLVVRWGNM